MLRLSVEIIAHSLHATSAGSIGFVPFHFPTTHCFSALTKNIYVIIETFLPFDLEVAFSSAFVLSLLSVVGFTPACEDSSADLIRGILDVMIKRGSIPAKFRLEELERLQDMLRLVASPMETENTVQSLAELDSRHDNNHGEGVDALGDMLSFNTADNTLGQGPVVDFGLSPEEMLSVAQLLEWDHVFPESGIEDDQGSIWGSTRPATGP